MSDHSPAPGAEPGAPRVAFAELLRVFARIGWTSFGGPTAQIALMHRVLVEEQRWLDEERYLAALGFCMLLPGPEAMQLATYAGWRLHGVRGGLAAGLLFVLPGALVVLVLSMVYAALGHVPLVAAAFLGIQACVLVLVLEALQRLGKRALKRPLDALLAAAAFVAIFAFGVPFPWIVLVAGVVGAALALPLATSVVPEARDAHPPWAATLRTLAAWLAIWAAPLLAVAAVFGREHLLTKLAWFFSKLAVVTFGGAYAVLSYMAQDVVVRYGWLAPRQMVDGLGLAETTPGPLILVTQFVGYVAAYGAHPEAAVTMGLLGAGIALWATFAPCFLWIFAGAPWLDRLSRLTRLRGALAGITAAVLGVILNLAVWFALHVLFARVGSLTAGPVRVVVPDAATLQPVVLVLAIASGLLLVRLRWSVHRTLLVSAAAAVAWSSFATP